MGPMALGGRLLVAAAGVLGLLYVVACAYLWVEQRSLIFLPDAVVRRTPAEFGLEFREVSIPVGGDAVSAWWLPAQSAPSSAVVLYLHGNDGNLGLELDRLRSLHQYGFPVLAIDYRGYGRSRGPQP